MFRLTVPMIFGMISMMLLGVVDTYFISMLGTHELAAVSFSQPIANILISVALGIGMALGALLSRLIGESQHQKAARFITDTKIIAALIAVIAAFIGFLAIDPLFKALGATEEVMPFIKSYMSIWFIAAPMWMLTMIGNNALRAIGDTKLSASIMALLSVINLIFDRLLIFGIGPFPKLGVAGAAWATLIACMTGWLCSIAILTFREQLLEFTRPSFSHLLPNWFELFKIAVPAIAANIMTPIAAAVLTAMIARYGVEAVAGFGVGARIEFISLIVVFALSSTLPMFIGQNIGAGKPHRAYRALMGGLKFSLIFQTGVYLLLLATSGYIASVFSDNSQVVGVIKMFLLVLPLTYGAHGIVILVMVSLNVLRRPRTALLTTVVRLLLLYLPLAYIGSLLGGINGLFIGAACGNIIAGLIAYAIIRRVFREQGITALETG